MSWQVPTAQWLEWIETDGQAFHQRWISCDEFDEDLRRRLEQQPFLGTSENTIVGRQEETIMTEPPPGGAPPDAFDSMATMVRMAPEGLNDDDISPAQTLVAGQVAPLHEAPAEMSDEIEVTVEGGGYEVALEVDSTLGAAAPARSGRTLRTEPVPTEDGAPQPINTDPSASSSGPSAVVPVPVEQGDLFIPVLVRAAEPEAVEAEPEAVEEPEPEPVEMEPEVVEAEPEPMAAEPEPVPASPGIAEPVSPASSGTMVVMAADPSELQAQPQSGHTVIVQTPYEPPPEERTMIAPEPEGPPRQPPPMEPESGPPVPVEPITDSGTIEAVSDIDVEDVEDVDAVGAEDKVVIDGGAPNVIAVSDSDAIDAIDIIEDEVEEVTSLEAAPAEESLPPTPPPAPMEVEAKAPATAVAEPVSPSVEPSRKAPRKVAKVAGWYDEVFAEHFAALRRKGRGKTAKADIEFFVQCSGLSPGARVLDVGCGDGAHSITLAQRGYAVTAVDNSSAQLERATAAAKHLGVQIDFRAADMRDMELGKFDGIVCLGTTFGYFDDDVNRSVLRKLRDHLQPGGKMLLQLFNRDYVSPRLPSRSWWQGHGCLVLDEAEMNYFTNRLHVHRTIVFEDGRQFEHDMVVRGYGAYELGRMCVEAGLRVYEISGSRHTKSRFYGATSPEIWLLVGRS
jgi:SAM-dependent methyltransferase